MQHRKDKTINRREFLKKSLIGGLGLIALSSSGCAGGKLRTGLTYLFDGGIKLENPAGYGKDKSVINYINNRFDVYTTEDRKALVFDEKGDGYIFKPFEDSEENKLERIADINEIMTVGSRIAEEKSFSGANNVEAVTDLVYCDNPEEVQRAPIGYVFLSPDKTIEVSKKGRETKNGYIEYSYNFRIHNKRINIDNVSRAGGPSGDGVGGAGAGPGVGGGAGGIGGDGVGGAGAGPGVGGSAR